MKTLISVIISILSIVALAEAVSTNDNPKAVKRNPFLAKTGGYIDRPGIKPGVVAIFNAQSMVPYSDLEQTANIFNKLLHVKVPVTPVDFKGDVKEMQTFFNKESANYAVFIVDNTNCCQTIGIFPDQKFAFVNVHTLQANGGVGAFLNARTRKELARAILFLTGGASSQGDNNVMGPISDISDLDKIGDDAIPVDVVARAYKYLPLSGCNTRTSVPYRIAVNEGWAPAPTNEYQKAIWDKVHKLPTEPIKIEPETKKVKE